MTRSRYEKLSQSTDHFAPRHLGSNEADQRTMLTTLGFESLDALSDVAVPKSIRAHQPLTVGASRGEQQALNDIAAIAAQNQIFRSLIGTGYTDCITPPVILRNILENPGWYTQYTPYQAEIAQGRLEALINYQTLIADLTGLPLANSSLLDEATAAAEAMSMAYNIHRQKKHGFLVSSDAHPQTIAVIQTRAEPLGIKVYVEDPHTIELAGRDLCGVLLQYPTTDGRIQDLTKVIQEIHAAEALAIVAADLLSLTLLRPPGEMGADIAIGSAQRFGVPMGFGGPHAAYLSTQEEHRRQMPGRIVGVSRDARGKRAYRLALQTREQHIRRDKATSNICTAQVLLAVMASMYAVYHGPQGLRAIAERVHDLTSLLALGLKELGFALDESPFFDTLRVPTGDQTDLFYKAAQAQKINLRRYSDASLGITLDERSSTNEVRQLLRIFAKNATLPFDLVDLSEKMDTRYPETLARTSSYLAHEVFHSYHNEHEMLRYMYRLQSRDLSLTTSMIPLGSCTMKLNATSEMIPVTWPAFSNLHPFAPAEQTKGYSLLTQDLDRWLSDATGFAAMSFQPNAGSQGEYAGLLVLRAYHHSRGDHHRDVCLIPVSAHGTNPASAVMAGFQVVPVACNDRGDIDIADLKDKAAKHAPKLGALMVTYPSTHGVFEEGIREICDVIHQHGGQVYMDGANMNAQVGLCRPGDIGADVCHLNLHKTFCLSEGTPVTLATGTTLPIEQLRVGQQVLAWSDERKGIESARLEAIYDTGTKPCVEVVFEDGRSIVCTEDHRVLTNEGWVEAGKLRPSEHKAIVGLEAPFDNLNAETKAEQSFRLVCGNFVFSMTTTQEREKTLAFFRLVGLLYSDGTFSEEKVSKRLHLRVFLGTQLDAKYVQDDIELLTQIRPHLSANKGIFSIRLPHLLLRAFQDIPGVIDPGKRLYSTQTLPNFVRDKTTPKAVLREFLGGLFGGDGSAPLPLYLKNNPDTFKEIRFSQSRLDNNTAEKIMTELQKALARLRVESTVSVPYQPNQRNGKAKQPIGHPESWRCDLVVRWGSAFAENVGFRYCHHKSARLSIATAWWRMKESIVEQKQTVAQRVLDYVADLPKTHQGPRSVWLPALQEIYSSFASEEIVLNSYYASFQGFKKLTKQHLVNAIRGQKGLRKNLKGLRRTNHRAVLPPTNRSNQSTGIPELSQFFERSETTSWFSQHTPLGQSFRVTYATQKNDEVAPTFKLGIAGIRSAGTRRVYDLTVGTLHSFLANSVVVHNCIPHGGGGPGMGPIGVAPHLVPFLPGHPNQTNASAQSIGPIAAAPFSSASILPISWMYIAMMGSDGLKQATQMAILNANYMAKRLEQHYDVLFRGNQDLVAHEFIIDLRPLKISADIEAVDIAKRLMDYGFHAPTMSWPVPGTLMIEPTESESKAELDRFCDAMISIREEIRAIEQGKLPKDNNPLKHAPHTAEIIMSSEWNRPYPREQAAYPAPWTRSNKFWPSVSRIDDAFGDRNLVCTCPPIEDYT